MRYFFPSSKKLRDGEIFSFIDKVFIANKVPNYGFNYFTKIWSESLIADTMYANYLLIFKELQGNYRKTDLAKLKATISILEEGKVNKGKVSNVMASPINTMK